MLHVRYHSDNFSQTEFDVLFRRAIGAKAKGLEDQRGAPSNGVFIGPIAARHRLIDDGYLGSIRSIAVTELPALHHGDAHRLEIAGTDVAVMRAALVPRGRCRRTLDKYK